MSGGGGTNTVTRTELDPAVRPYVQYGLSEAQNLYEAPTTPSFYPGQTYVSPSQQTQSAMVAAQNRASMGNPLNPAAQAQALSTIQGNYLGGNPFFSGAFNTAANAAQTSYQDAMNSINSNASKAGRYGSNAMGQLQDRATGQFAQSLTNTAGNLAYQNYDAERARQQSLIGAAPQLAQADYTDINQMLNLGQMSEGYQQAALDDSIQRFNFDQNLPQAKLNSYLNAAYGSPQGGMTTQPTYRNPLAGAIGGGIVGNSLFGGTPLGTAGGAILGGILS